MPVSIHSLSKASSIFASLLSPSLSTRAQSMHGKCSLSADSSKRRYLKPIPSSCLRLSWHLYKQETTYFWWHFLVRLCSFAWVLRKVANRTRFVRNHAVISPVTEWHCLARWPVRRPGSNRRQTVFQTDLRLHNITTILQSCCTMKTTNHFWICSNVIAHNSALVIGYAHLWKTYMATKVMGVQTIEIVTFLG